MGVTGLANAGEMLGYRYGTPQFMSWAEEVLAILRDTAYSVSSDLAVEKGSFPLYDKELYANSEFIHTLPEWLQAKIYKQGIRELKQLVHPQAIIPLKVGRRRVEASVVSAVWSFFAVYTTCFIIIMLLLMATGLDFTTAFSAVAASINNLGPGLGEVSANYSSISDTAKGILCFAMLLGRLEVFTLLVLFTPMFWRI